MKFNKIDDITDSSISSYTETHRNVWLRAALLRE